ncbi:MAG: NUDIX hydrolase [Candidatus Baltobacteraceae bacterium]
MTKGADEGWRIVDSEIVIETPYLRLRRDNIELPDGRIVENYFVRESRGFSVVFALTDDERVVLVRQYKHGIARSVLELPAGAIDPDESPADCARRELGEETGYEGRPPEPEYLATFIYDPTSSNTYFHVYLVRGARAVVAQSFDPTEAIEVELATLEQVRGYVRDGTISVSAHVAVIYYVLDRLGKL